jgi:hypothetical protein
LLAREAQPAVSLYLPTHVAGREIRQDGIRLKKLLAQTADRLHAEWRRSETDAFLAPAASLVRTLPSFDDKRLRSLVVGGIGLSTLSA